MFCRRYFNMAIRLKLRECCLMRGIKHWRSVGEKMSHLFAFSILELGNCCESDLHLLPFKYTELFQSLNANSSVKSPSFQSMPPWLHPYFISCQLFTSVFGVGPKTAEKWYRLGLRSFSDVLADHSIQLNRMQQYGTSISRFFYSATPEIIGCTL